MGYVDCLGTGVNLEWGKVGDDMHVELQCQI
jgi:hypothetical protein